MKKLSQLFSHWLLTIFLLAGLQFTATSQTATHLDFDGINDYVSAPSINFANQPFTIEFWAKRKSFGTYQYVVSEGNFAPSQFLGILFRLDNTISISFFNNDLNSNTQITDFNWHHYAFTFNSTTKLQAIYIDGVLDATRIATTNTSASGPFYIGQAAFGGQIFSGDLEELRIWNIERTQAAINTDKGNELNGNEPGLEAYYRFNQGIAGGNNTAISALTNSTANSHNGIFNNFALTGPASNFLTPSPVISIASNLHFDGVNDLVHCGTDFNTIFSTRNTATVEAWVKPETNTGIGPIAGNYSWPSDNPNMQFLLRREGANYVFMVSNSTNTGFIIATASNAVVLNSWQHLAGVRNGDQLMIYVNGVLMNTTTGVGTQNFPLNTGNEFTIGGDARVPAEFFQGSIDEVRVWTAAISNSEIVRTKNCELVGNEGGLYAYYKFNQGAPAGVNSGVTTLNNSTATAGLNGILATLALTGLTSNWLYGSPVATGIPIAPMPATTAQSLCFGYTVANLTPAPSASVKWYNVPTGGTPLASNTVLTPGIYYVEAVNPNGCVSNRNSSVVALLALPGAPVASAQSICENSLVVNLTPAPSDSVRWYNVPSGGNALADTTSLATGTYYVVNVNANGCESIRTAVPVTIVSTARPVADNQVYVGAGTIGNLTATGTNLKWYDAQTGGNLLTGSSSLTDGSTYYVSQTIACESRRTAVKVKKISEANQTVCSPAKVANLAATPGAGYAATWFNTISGGTALASTAPINSNTYYVAQSAMVSTTAGSSQGYSDGDAATAQFSTPYGVAVDNSGNIYVADQGNGAVRKISPDGQVTTLVAGIFTYITSVAVDTAGNVYATDLGQVFKITPLYDVSLLPGTYDYPEALATDTAGNVYVADNTSQDVQKVTPAGVVTVIGTGFASPTGLAVDNSGNVYVADNGAGQIKKITPAGLMTTLASGLSSPYGIAVDATGNVYVSDFVNHLIQKITPAGVVSTLAGSTSGFSDSLLNLALFNTPRGMAMDASGNLFIADDGNSKVRKLTTAAANNRVAVSVSVNSVPTMATGNISQTLNVSGATGFSSSCGNLICTVLPNGAGPVSGNTTAKVWIETLQNPQFVKRHYEITPASNASTATGKVTLYFTQAEFDDFNAVSSFDLPTGPADAFGKANLKIEKRSGISNDGSGLPGSYTGTVINIDPADADIIWNVTANRWEISFDVTGFSGFFVKTITGLLPISSINFSAVKQNNEVLLQWQNNSESNVHHYEPERSSNGSNFENIGNITARNAAGINSYQLSDNAVWTSELRYYRLKSVDNNGKVTYSPVVRLNSTQQNSISVYPNPVTDEFTIQLNGSKLVNSIAKLLDASGKTVQAIPIKNNNQTVDISNLSKGIYLLQFEDGTVMKIIKQ